MPSILSCKPMVVSPVLSSEIASCQSSWLSAESKRSQSIFNQICPAIILMGVMGLCGGPSAATPDRSNALKQPYTTAQTPVMRSLKVNSTQGHFMPAGAASGTLPSYTESNSGMIHIQKANESAADVQISSPKNLDHATSDMETSQTLTRALTK